MVGYAIPTTAKMEHEFYHAEEFTKIGKERFLEGEIGSFVTVTSRWRNILLREKYVLERIFENSSKYSTFELNYSKIYYQLLIQKALKRKVVFTQEFVPRIK